MRDGRLARALLAGGALGAAVGVVAALAEVSWVAWSVRGAGFRPDLLLYGALLDGGAGLALGVLLGASAAAALGRRGARGPRPLAPPAARPLSRRAALRLGLGMASLGLLGVAALACEEAAHRSGAPPRAWTLTPGAASPAARPPSTAAARPTAGPAAPTAQPAGPPSILLVTLDTLRADRLGAYGLPAAQTPTLDALARQGARFDLHVIQQPQTNPSHASILTGTYPASNGLRVHMVDKLSERFETLATVLSRAGYATAGLYSWMSLDPQYCQLQRGFDVYRDVAPNAPPVLDSPLAQQAAADYRVAQEYLTLPRLVSQATGVQGRIEATAKGRADATSDAAIAQLAAFGDRPFLLWLHYFDAHYPYVPPPELISPREDGYDGPIDSSMDTVVALQLGKLVPLPADVQHLVSLYQAEIAFLDLQLGRVLAALDALGRADTTLVAVTADHGEAFGEHPREIVGLTDFFHPHGLYHAEVRSPLLLRYPPRIRPGTVVAAPTQSIDLFPTLLELAGVAVPDQAQGMSLWGLLEGHDDRRGRAAYSALADGTFAALVVPGWKYIQNNVSGRRQLYDLRADPDETRDLAQAQPDLAARLAAQTAQWMKAVGLA